MTVLFAWQSKIYLFLLDGKRYQIFIINKKQKSLCTTTTTQKLVKYAMEKILEVKQLGLCVSTPLRVYYVKYFVLHHGLLSLYEIYVEQKKNCVIFL